MARATVMRVAEVVRQPSHRPGHDDNSEGDCLPYGGGGILNTSPKAGLEERHVDRRGRMSADIRLEGLQGNDLPLPVVDCARDGAHLGTEIGDRSEGTSGGALTPNSIT